MAFDLCPKKSNLIILEWTLVPKLKKIPQGLPETSWDGWTTPIHNALRHTAINSKAIAVD